MIQIVDKSKCSGCHACANICPANCIVMKKDAEGFLYPVVDESACVKCGLCDKSCPIITPLEQKNKAEDVFAFAAYTRDEQTRKNSSSGGIFTEFAKAILDDDGVVFGVVLDENLHAIHTYIENEEQLKKMQGSKYVQSTVGDSYKQAETFLKNDRKVFFTGTPCQIEGLYSYLKKEYKNLFTQDIICHGVPSEKVWEKYLEYKENEENKKIKYAFFRNKDDGWSKFNMKLIFENGKEYTEGHRHDDFMQAFLKNLCLRPSCYNCSFKNEVRKSDITLADFWGIDKVKPHFNDNKGVSLLLINSLKGKELFTKIQDNLVTERVADIKEAIKYNPAMVTSSRQHPNRKNFMKKVSQKKFNKLVEKNIKISVFKRVITKIKTLF